MPCVCVAVCWPLQQWRIACVACEGGGGGGDRCGCRAQAAADAHREAAQAAIAAETRGAYWHHGADARYGRGGDEYYGGAAGTAGGLARAADGDRGRGAAAAPVLNARSLAVIDENVARCAALVANCEAE